MKNPIVVIGAGLAGLNAALEIEAAGESCVIVDEASHVGGKLESTLVDDAYILDRGFQILLPAYPELQRLGNLETELDFKYFATGARLERDGGALLMGDPRRHPKEIASTVLGHYGSLKDKILVLKLQQLVASETAESLLKRSSIPTIEFLKQFGFSDLFINSFWKPFFTGVFLEENLVTAAGYFLYLVKMFASSPVAVPARGIGELPKLMSQRLKRTEIRLSCRATVTNGNRVELSNGEKFEARAVVTETVGHTQPTDSGPFGRVTSLWFSAPETPFAGAWLSLNSNEKVRSINHVAVLSNVSPAYAMKGDALICVNLVGESSAKQMSTEAILADAEVLYGTTTKTWKLLRRDIIDRALPIYSNRTDSDTPSQQGALLRGRRAAAAVLARTK